MIDEVLERREERDPLREAFRGTALEVMDPPQLKVQSEALEALSHNAAPPAKGFDQVAQARQRYLELLEWRATLLKTPYPGAWPASRSTGMSWRSRKRKRYRRVEKRR